MTSPARAMLRFGSFHGRVTSAHEEYTDALALVFGVELHPLTPEYDAGRHFELTITDATRQPTGAQTPAARPNYLTLGGTSRCPTAETDALHAELRLDTAPVEIHLAVCNAGVDFPALCVHFGVIIHKLLFYLDRLILHAAAVQTGGEVCLFVGDKGAGKSTTCLALARAGGTVLGEDRVVLWRPDTAYLVSGGDDRSRITERTEQHFFAGALAAPAKDFAGTMKKEIRRMDYFPSAPFQNFTPHRLIFPRVTGTFALRPLRPQVALGRMLAYNGHFQRFAGARDQADFLGFLAGFVASVSCWDLTLSDDLAQLEALPEALRHA